MIKELILVGLGGGIGSIFRYLSSVLINKNISSVFPFATFIVNILGCLLIGFLIGLAERNGVLDKNLRLLLITGFCGGYTTFSTFSSENLFLLQANHYFALFTYIVLSVAIGLFAVWLGIVLSRF